MKNTLNALFLTTDEIPSTNKGVFYIDHHAIWYDAQCLSA